jgi:DNA-binding FrmR family transcriptional regulator
MAHLSNNKDALVQRIHRIIGQLQAIERGVVAEADCAKTLHLTAAVRGAVGGLMDELIEAHVREHVADRNLTPDKRDQGAEALISAIRRYAK